MNDDDLRKFLEDNKAEFERAMKAKIIESITQRVQWDLPSLIQKQVIEFYETQMKADINAYLQENKSKLMEVFTKACIETAGHVATGMVEKVKETMDKSNYNRDAVFKALFDLR